MNNEAARLIQEHGHKAISILNGQIADSRGEQREYYQRIKDSIFDTPGFELSHYDRYMIKREGV